MSTEAQKRASINYNRKQDNIMIRPSKEEGAAIRASAAAAGMSVQAYVLRAVRVWMEQEHKRAGSDPGDPPVGDGDTEDKENVPQTTAAVSHTRDEKLSPAKLSPDDWAEWARRQDNEPLDDWMTRLKKSNIGIPPADIMKRIGNLPKHDRDLILGTDLAAGGSRGAGR